MSSALPTNRIRQNSPSHFMTIGPMVSSIYAYNPTGGQVTFSTASWAWTGTSGATAGTPYVSSLTAAGALLKDIGKSVVSSNRYFRKIQLVVRNSGAPVSTGASTFGVAGTNNGSLPNSDYLTGYIELGLEGGGAPAPVVQFGVA